MVISYQWYKILENVVERETEPKNKIRKQEGNNYSLLP